MHACTIVGVFINILFTACSIVNVKVFISYKIRFKFIGVPCYALRVLYVTLFEKQEI